MHHAVCQLTVSPETERVAIGVKQVGQRLQLLPLQPIVSITVTPRVRALPGRFHLDETYQRLADGYGVIASGLEV